MPTFDLMPFSSRALGIVVLLALLAGGSAMLAWQFQDWRYGQQLARLAQSQAETLNQMTQAAATQQKAEQDKRAGPGAAARRQRTNPLPSLERCPT